MDYARLEKQMEFCKEIDKEKLIGRQTYLTDGSRKENDAEHAWHMALMAVVLQEYSNEEIDLLKSMTMMLIHDIVEIDAGDTFAYDEEGKKDQRERELKAAERLFGMLPEDQGAYFRQLWDEFEAMSTPEARFARTLDNIQPTMLNASSGGKGWSEKGVHIDQVMERQSYTGDGSRVLWDYSLNNYIKPNVEKGTIKSK
ncbi:MAG: HD domain-containing protein [Clostridiales bacterium]|nr:HD domain-containing protein [Clostridiales bacterium]MDD7015791.1 HD domain-containing protein [Bacillota bacterium]MDY4958718.1 HD domain-containing protein [Lentihominibacter sp.]